MDKYAFLPLDGLFANEKEINSTNIGEVISYAENNIKSLPEGRTTSLVLLFYFICYLKKTNLPFYIKGGIPLHYYLKDKARPTYDLDIITSVDGEIFYQTLNTFLNSLQGELTFKILKYKENEADEHYYYDTFTMKIEALLNGNVYKTFILDCTKCSLFNEINYLEYKAPKYILDSFYGVEIEYLMADKIMAITGPNSRPIKHLIDVYSLINTSIDINKLKMYLDMILKWENTKRKEPISSYKYIISDNKWFIGNYILSALSVGYNITFDEMKDKINKWMEKNL